MSKKKKIYCESYYEKVIRSGKNFSNTLNKEDKENFKSFLSDLLKLIANTTAPGIKHHRRKLNEIY